MSSSPPTLSRRPSCCCLWSQLSGELDDKWIPQQRIELDYMKHIQIVAVTRLEGFRGACNQKKRLQIMELCRKAHCAKTYQYHRRKPELYFYPRRNSFGGRSPGHKFFWIELWQQGGSVSWRPKAPCNSRLHPKFGRCLFLKSAMFNNHCVPNCVRWVARGTIEIIAVRWLSRGHCFCVETIIKTSLHQGDRGRRGVVYLLRGHSATHVYQTRNISNHQAFWVPLRQMQVATKTALDWSR